MGRTKLGATSGVGIARREGNLKHGRPGGNTGSFNFNGGNMAAGEPTRFPRKHPLPGIGDRFGELTVTGYNLGPAGGPSALLTVQCSCGAEPHRVYDYNLRKGASTRCRVCAVKKAGHWRKNFWAYADIVPSDDHRRRLLNRISACINRCHNPKDRGFPNYGARGIFVYEPWRTDRRAYLAYLVTLEGWDEADLELDRIDVDKGYQPGNLRFITHRENQGNRRKVRAMQDTIERLETENASLRRSLRRAEEQIYGANGTRPSDSP